MVEELGDYNGRSYSARYVPNMSALTGHSAAYLGHGQPVYRDSDDG